MDYKPWLVLTQDHGVPIENFYTHEEAVEWATFLAGIYKQAGRERRYVVRRRTSLS